MRNLTDVLNESFNVISESAKITSKDFDKVDTIIENPMKLKKYIKKYIADMGDDLDDTDINDIISTIKDLHGLLIYDLKKGEKEFKDCVKNPVPGLEDDHETDWIMWAIDIYNNLFADMTNKMIDVNS